MTIDSRKRKNLVCTKCGKKADKFGHLVEDLERNVIAYYHWNCYDLKYNALIENLIKDAKRRKL